MLLSAIIATVGRPSLQRAVESVIEQRLPGNELEIIVVNDAGEPLPRASWLRSANLRVIDTHGRERSVARNTGAAISHGHYLHFLDDDDWLAEGALAKLSARAEASDAAWVYGASQLVDHQFRPLIQLRHGLEGNCFLPVMAGEWIPLQASLIQARLFFAIGGFNPRIAGPEDIDLLRRVAGYGLLAEIPDIVAYIVRGNPESTTDYDDHGPQSRAAREHILERPGVFTRLSASATSSRWYGRLARLYATSMVWNLQRKRPLTAASRAAYLAAALTVANVNLFRAPFWGALMRSYESDTFARGFAAVRSVPGA